MDGDTHAHNTYTTRRKINFLNFTYLWRYRLGHIGKKRMKKFHSDELLES